MARWLAVPQVDSGEGLSGEGMLNESDFRVHLSDGLLD